MPIISTIFPTGIGNGECASDTAAVSETTRDNRKGEERIRHQHRHIYSKRSKQRMMEDIQDLLPLKNVKKKAKNGQEKINFTLANIQPITLNQKVTFREYNLGKHLMLLGSAGTGKTFILLYLALNQILNENSPYKKIVIIRSVVPTRQIGFLPGSPKEKAKVYEAPYYNILSELFGRGDSYDYLKNKGLVEFMTTSFIRGITLNDCIVLVDEIQNCIFHELDFVLTRIGQNCRVLFAGDAYQSDFIKYEERHGLKDFVSILKKMNGCGPKLVEFTHDDIVRSELVKEYIKAKDILQIAV